MIYIELTQGKQAIVDDVDNDLINYNWKFKQGSSPGAYGYAGRAGPHVNGKQTQIAMHRVILERMLGIVLTKNDITDHINHDGLDNRRVNLRCVNCKQNTQYRTKSRLNKSSIYKGVSWHKRDLCWQGTIRIDGNKKSLGYFDKELDAALAYDSAATLYFGEYAVLNFIKKV
jgi:hypothetical protein